MLSSQVVWIKIVPIRLGYPYASQCWMWHSIPSQLGNVDLRSVDSLVIGHDLRKGLPFPDWHFDVVCHSHVLEHFPESDASRFLGECYRVLKPQGVIRVAVPDLERIVRAYVEIVGNVDLSGDVSNADYDWIMLEMYDQVVRERSGGELLAYWQRNEIPNREFVLKRCGAEARRIIEASASKPADNLVNHKVSRTPSFLRRLLYFVRDPVRIREKMLHFLLGPEYELLQLRRFRQPFSAAQSQIPRWSEYNLDTEADGTIYKPDSLYMEAVKA